MKKDKTSEGTGSHLKNDLKARETQKEFVAGSISFREFLHKLYTIQKEKVLNGKL